MPRQGHRETFDSPGMQWISVGSGIEHAEGGGTPKGEFMHGFQIWVNVPSSLKMEPPKYGTEPPDHIPIAFFGNEGEDGNARILAGDAPSSATYIQKSKNANSTLGPFSTKQPVQIFDLTLPSDGNVIPFILPQSMDNALFYVYDGSALVNGEQVLKKQIIKLEPTGPSHSQRTINVQALPTSKAVKKDEGYGTGHAARAMLFCGKKLNQPIAWRGCVCRACISFHNFFLTKLWLVGCFLIVGSICILKRIAFADHLS